MKKLDKTPDDDLLGVFQQEKRKELGGVVPVAKVPRPQPVPSPVVVAPPPDDPRLVALRAETTALQAALAQAKEALQVAQAGLQLAMTTQERLDQERRQADKRAAQAHERARGLEAALAAADKSALWTERGLSRTETAQALALLAVEQPQPLLAALMAVEPQPLAQLLNDRLALVCAAAECQPTKDTAVLRVAAERCELCGGSDLRGAYRTFAQATVTARLPSVTFIGGSPAYREALRTLHRELKPAFELEVVAKKRPGEGKRAQAARGLIVIWGGSEVDHDTTIHYRQSGDLVLTMNHRGLSGILPKLAAQLQKTARS